MAFLFTNCEPDINTDIKAKESSRFSTQDLNTEQIRSKKHITEKLQDLNLENAASHDSQNKIVYNGIYGFTVNTDLVTFVEDLETGNHSYSFSIQRDSLTTNNLENLLLQYNPADGDYYAYIVQYAFTNAELQDLNETFLNSTNTIIFPIDYDISTLELGKMVYGCSYTWEWSNSNVEHAGGLHGLDCCNPIGNWILTEVSCGYYDDGSGSGDGNPAGDWIPNTVNEPGGGYGDPNNPNNNGSGPTEIFAVPTPTQTQAELLATYLDLNPQQEIWANKSTNLDKVRAINNYLFTNCAGDNNSTGCQEARTFVIAALEALNNGTIVNFEDYFTPENVPPDCESFNYQQVGNNNWQCASIIGIHELFTIVNWQCIGAEMGIFHQPLYFQLPINLEYPLGNGSTATDSAILLQLGFESFDNWYQQNGCNTTPANMTQVLFDYIKNEFEEVGGNVTLTPPLGFNTTPTVYKYKWFGYGNCN